MIIQLRGTSGSGKTTVVRKVMELYAARANVKIPGRRRPLGYVLTHPHGGRPLAVLGHYETACGGCDTLPSLDRIIELVRQSHAQGYDVLFEGLLISGETRRCIELHKDGLPYEVLALRTDLQTCIDSVNARRREKDPERENVNPANTEAKYKTVQSSMRKLQEAGVMAEWFGREEAVRYIAHLLRLNGGKNHG